jgi:hypothetical protein
VVVEGLHETQNLLGLRLVRDLDTVLRTQDQVAVSVASVVIR